MYLYMYIFIYLSQKDYFYNKYSDLNAWLSNKWVEIECDGGNGVRKIRKFLNLQNSFVKSDYSIMTKFCLEIRERDTDDFYCNFYV